MRLHLPQFSWKMRESLLDWLHEVIRRKNLSAHAYYLCANIINLFLRHRSVSELSGNNVVLSLASR